MMSFFMPLFISYLSMNVWCRIVVYHVSIIGCCLLHPPDYYYLRNFENLTSDYSFPQIPLSHISETVYKTSTDWINQHSIEALGSFVLWSLESLLADLSSQLASAKGSKKGVQHVSSKSQVVINADHALSLERNRKKLFLFLIFDL